MTCDGGFSIRAARPEYAETILNITKASIGSLAAASYSRNQIEFWMGERTPAFYQELIAAGRMTVWLRVGAVVGFVDAEPGEINLSLPEAAGVGLGRRLLRVISRPKQSPAPPAFRGGLAAGTRTEPAVSQ